MARKLSQIPVFAMWIGLKSPDPNTMALGGVATGNMNAMDAARAAAAMRGRAGTPSPSATPAMSGMPRADVAVLLVSSVRKTKRAVVASTTTGKGAPRSVSRRPPIHSVRPLAANADASANPDSGQDAEDNV